MDNYRYLLETLFYRVSPNLIINSIRKNKNRKLDRISIEFVENFHVTIVQHLIESHPTSSEDEREQIYRILLQETTRDTDEKNCGIFNLLNIFTNRVLIEKNYKPFCKYHQLMRWRMVTLKLEEDLFTSFYLAHEDWKLSKKRSNYVWEPIIKTDNIRLHNMLQEGLAENHFHLFGSAPYVQLSWINLMNRIVNRNKDFKDTGMLDNALSDQVLYSDQEIEQNDSIKTLVIKAAIIRLYLYEQLFKKSKLEDRSEELISKEDVYKVLMMDEKEVSINLSEYQDRINTYRFDSFIYNGYRGSGKIDYILDRRLASKNIHHNLFLVSERKFLYEAFYKMYSEDEGVSSNEDLLYLYILIKSKFRNEMIQSNDRYGFKNFSDYQSRKAIFLKNDQIFMEALAFMAVESSCKDQNIRSLEARITPKKDGYALNETINGIDRVVQKAKEQFGTTGPLDKYDDFLNKNNSQEKKSIDEENPLFYVIHMPKRADTETIKLIDDYNKKIKSKSMSSQDEVDMKMNLKVRNSTVRQSAKNSFSQILEIREKYNDSAFRLFGIDACSNEIGCRAEVFSQAIRAIRNHMNKKQIEIHHIYKYNLPRKELPIIKVTYHAGEDFLDLVDGLRAIDEAIIFNNMCAGDRIGHALALGVDGEEWYNFKRRKISLPNQDYLDNLAWLIRKITVYKINVDIFQLEELKNEFKRVCSKIYNFETDFNNENFSASVITPNIYYNSMLLRGDAPELYRSNIQETKTEVTYWSSHNRNFMLENGDEIRKSGIERYLYHLYHFNFDVRRNGMIVEEHSIDRRLIQLISEIQGEMQVEIRNKGIGIECNPSSNYLIGTFKRYDKHPILNFNNFGLEDSYISNNPQMFVSINTDDQGVFGTYLENEYALMSLALEKAKDIDGKNKYNPEMIYRWLDNIRKMGLQQSFRLNKRL